MKMNKKLIVPFLSTVVGISMAAGIGGAVAWYQYNSQVTASFVGSSVADSTLLQIGHIETTVEQGQSVDTMVWERDYNFFKNQTTPKLVPVTFGALDNSNAAKPNLLATGGTYAYGYPEAGIKNGTGYSQWAQVAANDGYVRKDIYLRALNVDNTHAALDVYLSDITLEIVKNNNVVTDDSVLADALRIHLDIEGNGNQPGDPTNKLISKKAIVATTDPAYSGLSLSGKLDLDGVAGNDTQGGYSWSEGNTTEITYGVPGQYQTTLGAGARNDGESDNDYRSRVNSDANIVSVVREANGTIASSNSAKKICTTKSTSNVDEIKNCVKITITVWLEGWALLKTGDNTTSSVWNPAYSAGVDVRVGMTFDTGRKA